MVQPPKPTKTQQAVAANKAAQQQRQQRVAETTQKLSQIQTKPKRVTKPVTQQVAVEPVATVPTTFVPQVIDDTEDRIDSIAFLQDLFAQYGLASLANTIVDLKQQGLTDRLVAIKLKETPEYKQRFIGNENRKKAGLQPLTPAEYISAEAST